MYLSFALKIAFSNFFSLRKKLLSICGICILIICLVAPKHRIGVLRSSKEVILCNWAVKWLVLQKRSNSWKSVFCIAINILVHEKETFFMYLSFALKIAFSNFFSLRKKLLSICGICILLICLVALNTELVFLEALKKWFCAIKL